MYREVFFFKQVLYDSFLNVLGLPDQVLVL